MNTRHNKVQEEPILAACALLSDPREWPNTQEGMATFGKREVQLLLDHFSIIHADNECDPMVAQRNEWPAVKVAVTRMTARHKQSAWSTFLQNPARRDQFPFWSFHWQLLVLSEGFLQWKGSKQTGRGRFKWAHSLSSCSSASMVHHLMTTVQLELLTDGSKLTTTHDIKTLSSGTDNSSNIDKCSSSPFWLNLSWV